MHSPSYNLIGFAPIFKPLLPQTALSFAVSKECKRVRHISLSSPKDRTQIHGRASARCGATRSSGSNSTGSYSGLEAGSTRCSATGSTRGVYFVVFPAFQLLLVFYFSLFLVSPIPAPPLILLACFAQSHRILSALCLFRFVLFFPCISLGSPPCASCSCSRSLPV